MSSYMNVFIIVAFVYFAIQELRANGDRLLENHIQNDCSERQVARFYSYDRCSPKYHFCLGYFLGFYGTGMILTILVLIYSEGSEMNVTDEKKINDWVK